MVFCGNFGARYRRLMNGSPVDFNENEVIELLHHLDYYKINTLMVQSHPLTSINHNYFVCKVDKETIRAYKKEQESEMRIV